MTQLCADPTCDAVGVFAGELDGLAVMFCFVHDQSPMAATEAQEAPEAAGEGFYEDVTAGLAAMILEHTAMTVLDAVDATGDAMRSLAANTAFTQDVAAGILLATTWLMAAGQVDAEMIMRGAELYEAHAEGDDFDELVAMVEPDGPDDIEGVAACDLCGRTDDHVHEESELDAPAGFDDHDDDLPSATADGPTESEGADSDG